MARIYKPFGLKLLHLQLESQIIQEHLLITYIVILQNILYQ